MTPKEIGETALHALERLADWCIVSTFFLLCCLPLITCAAAAGALYDTAARYLIYGSGSLKTTFFSSFRRDWKSAIPLSLALLGAAVLVSAYLYFGGVYPLSGGLSAVYWLAAATVSAVFAGVLLWAVPVFSRFSQKTGTILKAAFALAAGCPVRTLAVLGLLAACGILCLYAPILLFLLPGITAEAAARVQEPILKRHTAPGESPAWQRTEDYEENEKREKGL